MIQLSVSELKTALTGLSKVISRRTTLPVLDHLRVTRDAEGTVTLQATDLDTTVTYRVTEPNAGSPCDFLVPYEPLNKLVKGGKEPVQLSVAGQNQVRIKTHVGSSPMEQTLNSLPVTEDPPVPQVVGKGIVLDATFRDCLRQALDCCSEDSTRHILRHVCVDTRHREGHYLAASDGRHLFCANSFQFDLKTPVLIPDQPFLHWSKFLEDGTGELRLKPKANDKDTGPWVLLQSGPWTFVSLSSADEFPIWKNALPAQNSRRTRVQLDRSAVETLLAGLPRLPGHDDPNRPATLEVEGNALVLKAKARDAKDWTSLTVDGAQITGRDVSISVNRDYLLKALRFGLTTFEIEDGRSPLDCIAGGRRLVVMPIRAVEADAPTNAAAPTTTAPASVPNPQPTNNSNNPPVIEPPATQPSTQPTHTMSKTTETTPTNQTLISPTPTPTPATPTAEPSTVKGVMLHIENIKESLKGVLREFATVLDDLKQLEKEKRASDREMESVREKLREIQAVRI